MNIKKYFKREQSARKGLMAIEWVIIIYAALTLLIVLFGINKLQYPDAMIFDRLRMVAITLGMWAVYKLVPCRATRMLRVLMQFALIGWWYTDTYSINCLFPNLDHIFASLEQSLFGYQPALIFCENYNQIWFSELMDMAYASYFPIIAVVTLYYFFKRYKEFERTSFIIIASFFAFYVIYAFVPVTGPMYYYKAVGLSEIAHGSFPAIGDYFNTHLDMLESPGYKDGIFYHIINNVHNAGERPTAAFPSSHVGISLICMILAWRSGSRRLFFILLPFAVLICFATVYIRAHYVIDVFAGLIFGVVYYVLWSSVAKRLKL
ncbi:MAG: phosphatase PAP2 family protein [Prevotella sp.]|nr:phosphatase PAP2 family protein [Prevotella sp.]MDD4532961.1 phosphatase PAP2 family protein [Prevotella sp.]